MVQSFVEPTTLGTAGDVAQWRSRWMQELKSWHSPYKVIVDCSKLIVADAPDVQEAIQRMLKFYEGLFLKSIVGYSPADPAPPLPFEVVKTFEEAQIKAGVRGMRSPTAPADFRSTIQFQNHFAQHVVELSFSDDVKVESKEQILVLKSKLTNNLMQWHSKWSLLVDCSRVEFDPGVKEEWEKVQKFLSGFFMKAVIGYGPKGAQDSYPFPVYRARHKAVAQLEAEGMFMGNDAHCRSTKAKT